jgi:hypothetical protein
MSNGMKVQYKVHFQTGRESRKELHQGEAKPVSPGRVPRISRLMALAIRFDGLIRSGVVTDQAELARLGHVTPARVTQIMNMLCLAPDIQEELLFLPLVHEGRGVPWERRVRKVVGQLDWAEQRRMWARFANATSEPR